MNKQKIMKQLKKLWSNPRHRMKIVIVALAIALALLSIKFGANVY